VRLFPDSEHLIVTRLWRCFDGEARTSWSERVLDELEELFRRQRTDLEHGLDSEQTTTEDLRQALRRYRSFFDRLLSF